MKMKSKNKLKKGFTLIELLVVVLIIGVLAAIAVTQYKKSVLKSKYATLLPLTKALYDSQEMLDLTRGHYTDDFSDLELPNGETISGNTAAFNGNTFTLGNNDRHIYIKATKVGLNNNYVMFQSKSKYFPNEIHCEAKTDDSLANWLCESELGGIKLDRALTEGYTDYVIRGTGNGFFPVDWENANSETLTNGDTCRTTDSNYNGGYRCYNLQCINCTVNADHWPAGDDSVFSNGSVCVGNDYSTCRTSTFTNSTCIGNTSQACGGYNVFGYTPRSSVFVNSICQGNFVQACAGNVFKGNSVCYANVKGTCGSLSQSDGTEALASVYEDDACCIGEFCPDYAPICP